MTHQRNASAAETASGPTGDGFLICPECGVPLSTQTETVACPQCSRVWPVINGTAHFVDKFPYWGEIPQREIQEVNRQAETRSWKSLLIDSPVPAVKRASGMILNLDRANWQWLLDLPPEARVLDIGAGMGTISHALALHYREVVAVEPVLERVRFMEHRFRQEKLHNIKLLRSSLSALPLPSHSFDLAVMNGVLEWVPEGAVGDPRDLQLDALRKVHKLLRPGGCLYVGIENRLVPGYFIGYRDPHCGLPFVTVLPRSLAHWYSRKRGQPNGYRNYLYSSNGYRKLLLEAGFSKVSVYVALPSYNEPRYMIPLENNLFSFYSRTFTSAPSNRLRRFVRGVLLRAGLLKYCEYSFIILAHK